ncbi:MAG: DUF1150 family protein [Azospirillaceae bacterium]|nr:DUF1150 family protein [Azospirillaceae bacterium]
MPMTPTPSNPADQSDDPFALFGARTVAYIKPVIENGRRVMSIHSADGTPLGTMDNRETAIVACLREDLEPMSVH